MQSSRWTSIGREILFSARTELYMNLPFLDSALAALPAADGYDTPTLATDTRVLFFSGAWLAQQYERSRANVNRAYLHTLFHCLLRHPGKTRGRDADLWDLSCDIAVESMLDSLDYRCLQAEKVSVRRQNIYRELRDELPVLTAEAVYRHFRRTRLNSYDCATLTRVFAPSRKTRGRDASGSDIAVESEDYRCLQRKVSHGRFVVQQTRTTRSRSAGAPLAAAGRAHADRDGDGFCEQGGRRSGCAGAACRFHPQND